MKIEMPESVVKILADVVFAGSHRMVARGFRSYKNEKEEKEFKENPGQFLVSLLLALRERLRDDWISAMLDSSVGMATYSNYLEEAQKLLEEEEKHPREKVVKKGASKK